MTISADVVRVAEVPEVTFGVTPDTPAFEVVRLTGESLAFTPTTTVSASMNPKRSVEDSILTGGGVSGAINFELAKEVWLEDLLSGAMCADWATDSLKVGTKLKSFTLEKTLPIDATDTDYHRIPGSIMNGFTLTIAPNAPITGTFDILGKEYDVDPVLIAGGTYDDPSYNPIFTAPRVTEITISGIVTAAQCFTNITLTLANNNRALECIGHLGAREMALGRAEVTLAFSLYYADSQLLEDLKAQTELAISFKVTDSAVPANWYSFTIPRAKLTQCTVVAGGTGQDVIADCVAQGLLDPVSGTPLQITRNAAAAVTLGSGDEPSEAAPDMPAGAPAMPRTGGALGTLGNVTPAA